MASRFAAGLGERLTARGRVYLLLSTFGDACAVFVEELERRGYRMSVLRGAALHQRARHHSGSVRGRSRSRTRERATRAAHQPGDHYAAARAISAVAHDHGGGAAAEFESTLIDGNLDSDAVRTCV